MTVFNTWAGREQDLRAAACALSSATTMLLARLTAGPATDVSCGAGAGGGGSGSKSAAEALAAFDGAWADYLALFAAWKRHDAAALEVRRLGLIGFSCFTMSVTLVPSGDLVTTTKLAGMQTSPL